MQSLYLLTCILLFWATIKTNVEGRKIPDSLSIGCAISSYQVEGAWNVSDRSPSYWDNVAHKYRDQIVDGTTCDVTCDFYHRYKDDLQYLSDIGFNHFRFSLSWTRLLPNGTPDYVSKDGVRFYHNLLDELEARNITPIMTIYHWDHPQIFERDGGLLNDKFVDRFGDYARFVFQEFGPRVKLIATVNEPNIFCTLNYKEGSIKTQLYNMIKTKEVYLCVHNLLKAHARAYHIYDEFRAQQKGSIGLINLCNYHYARPDTDPNVEDVAFQFECGWISHPIFSKEGNYPEVMRKRVAEMSKFENLMESKLPEFSDFWINYLRGTADYYGLNHYVSQYVVQLPEFHRSDWPNDEGLEYQEYYSVVHKNIAIVRSKEITKTKVPRGAIDLLKKITEEYGNLPIYILENGAMDNNGTEDNVRIDYHHDYMNAFITAIEDYGIDLRAYTVWSLMDNWQGFHGYTQRYGLISVDFNGDLKRTPKKSAFWFKSVLQNREIQPRTPSTVSAALTIT